ncbi:MAG: hypothetical protein AAB300_03605 [Nitrospirota bacterium]
MIKSCSGFEELCTFVVSGAATDDEEKKLSSHLSSCVSCGERLQLLQEVSANMIMGMAEVAPNPLIRANLLKAIEQEKQITPRLYMSPSVQPQSTLTGFSWFLAAGWGVALILAVALLKNKGIFSTPE